MPRRQTSSPAAAVVGGVLLSVLLHGWMWALDDVSFLLRGGSGPLPQAEGFMAIELQPEDEQEQLHDDDGTVKLPGQLVNLDKVEQERPPDKSTRISEFDNVAKRETRANPSARPGRARGNAPVTRKAQAAPTPAAPANPGAVAKSGLALPLGGRIANGDAAAASDSESEAAGVGDRGRGTDSGSVMSLSPRGLGPSRAQLEQWSGGGSKETLDEDLPIGAGNMLDTHRWRYASFFNRVRNAIDKEWEPEVLHAARDPDGRVYGSKTRKTRLVVILNPDGSLHRVRLDRSSDVRYLDEEAIRAVRIAAPFRNPPAGLVAEQSGLIEFGFLFIFEINGGRRIHRYRR